MKIFAALGLAIFFVVLSLPFFGIDERKASGAKATCQDYTEQLRGHVIKGGQGNAEKHGDGWRVLVRYFETSNPDQITRATAECVLDKDLQLVVLRRFNNPAQD